jgi:hypothetical protein
VRLESGLQPCLGLGTACCDVWSSARLDLPSRPPLLLDLLSGHRLRAPTTRGREPSRPSERGTGKGAGEGDGGNPARGDRGGGGSEELEGGSVAPGEEISLALDGSPSGCGAGSGAGASGRSFRRDRHDRRPAQEALRTAGDVVSGDPLRAHARALREAKRRRVTPEPDPPTGPAALVSQGVRSQPPRRSPPSANDVLRSAALEARLRGSSWVRIE